MMLEGKTILITGAGRGIGLKTVEVAVREGARVIAHVGRHLESRPEFDQFNKRQVHQISGDLAASDGAEKIWKEALCWAHRIDVLINNAGVYVASPIGSEEQWNSGWNSNLMINLQAPANLCRSAIKHFISTGEGTIINMASRSSHRGDDSEHLAYGAAKGGLLALTKGISRSYATNKTLAYAVAPAWVRTEMAEAHIALKGEANVTEQLPMCEITPATDVAEMVVFLASGRSRHANGCTIDITGADYVR